MTTTITNVGPLPILAVFPLPSVTPWADSKRPQPTAGPCDRDTIARSAIGGLDTID